MSEQATTSVTRAAPPIPDYELLRVIGRGAYGEVWLARNVTGSLVALKIVHRAAFDHDRPFEREFDGIKRFEPISRSDSSQLAIFHVGRGDGFFYYVMELADAAERSDGVMESWSDESKPLAQRSNTPPLHYPSSYQPLTLKRLLNDRGALPTEECIKIALSLTRALAHLHGHGLVHRDVKPSNVIFVNGVAKLADIGLVTSVDATRSFVGTEGYLPPEGAGTPQADLYSLGKVLYEMSTGCDRKQFPALPPDIATRPDRDALAELNAIVVRACQIDPAERYAGAEAIRAELESLRSGQSVIRKRTWEQRWILCRKVAIVLSILVVAATAGMLLRHFGADRASTDWPLSTDLQANVLCDQAMSIIRSDRYNEFPSAYTNFIRALELDTRFARPWAGLMELALRETNPDVKGKPLDLRQIAAKLNELAPGSAASYCASSIVSFYDLDFPRAERNALLAIKIDPGYELGHSFYGWMLGCWGRPKEARAQVEISYRIAPGKAIVYRGFGNICYSERAYTNAIKWYRQALAVEPNHANGYWGIGCAFRALGDYTNALHNFEQGDLLTTRNRSQVRQRYQALRDALVSGGSRGYWEQEWKLTEGLPDRGYYWKAVIQKHLENANEAFKWLEKSFAVREGKGAETYVTKLLWDDCWDDLRDHPRFRALLDQIGFTKTMPPRK